MKKRNRVRRREVQKAKSACQTRGDKLLDAVEQITIGRHHVYCSWGTYRPPRLRYSM